ncbi:hypothetical protein MMC25_004429 [Agyrium rufum]|nr:hypothetical protein [Agyrium rufum]
MLRSYKGRDLSAQNLVPFTKTVYDAPYMVIHRADLQRHMVAEAQRLGIEIRLGCHISNISVWPPAISMQNGETFLADLVVGADGLHSVCRDALFGSVYKPRPTGDMAYRIVVKMTDLEKESDLLSLTDGFNINCWMGPDAHLVCYQLKDGGFYNVVVICPDTMPSGQDMGRASSEELMSRFQGWDPRLLKLFGLAQPVLKWRLQDSVEMIAWSSPNKKLILLGDACHATLPYLAQGAAMAIEDGEVLGLLFERLKKKSQIPELVRTFEQLRKPRATAMVNGSKAQRGIFHMHDGPAQMQRDAQMLTGIPVSGNPNRWADPDFQEWLFGYDADAAVETAWPTATAVTTVERPGNMPLRQKPFNFDAEKTMVSTTVMMIESRPIL